MDAYTLARAIFDNDWLRFIGALVAANVLGGIAIALFTNRRTFYLGELATFLQTRVIPYLLGWGAVKLIAITALGETQGLAQAAEAATSVFVIGALIGHINGQLRELGLPIPVWATDQRKPEVTATP